MARRTANDEAWEQAFESLNLIDPIRQKGWVDVTAKNLRQFREPRLMAKIDYSANRPEIFRQEGLNILSLSSSHYRIGKFDVFRPIPEEKYRQAPITRLELPVGIESLPFKGLTSESSVVTSAHAAGILEKFCGDELLLTSFGRMRTPQFDFTIAGKGGDKYNLSVNSATIEIDAAFENSRALHVFEVKNHRPGDFNMRQLYYPYRTWKSKIHKPVEPVFMTYSNDVYDLYQLSFIDDKDFSSSVIERHERFVVGEGSVLRQDLQEIALRVSMQRAWNDSYRSRIPFPQADSFTRVIDLVSILIEQPMSAEELTTHYGFDARQSDYYYNAAKYLGLADSSRDGAIGSEFRFPTQRAKNLFSLSYREKFLGLASLVLAIEPINEAFRRFESDHNRAVSRTVQDIFCESAEAKVFGYAATTIERRSQTIQAWVAWLNSLPEG